MRRAQANLLKARDVVEQVMRRERKKRDSVVRPGVARSQNLNTNRVLRLMTHTKSGFGGQSLGDDLTAPPGIHDQHMPPH